MSRPASVAPGLYAYENGVRTALLEFGAGDAEYLLLRVPVAEGAQAPDIVPYLVLNGRIVPPIDIGSCEVRVGSVQRSGTSGSVDCAAVARAVLSKLDFSAGAVGAVQLKKWGHSSLLALQDVPCVPF